VERPSLGEQTKGANGRKLELLKKPGPARLLAMTIRGLEVELWEHPPPSSDPYVRLIIAPDAEHGTGRGQQELSDGQPIAAVLEPLEATALSTAIEQWATSLSGTLWATEGPALFTTVASVAIALWSPPSATTPRAEITLTGETGLCATATLTPLEAALLAGAIDAMLRGENEGQE
jgi:hypothetical protein